MLEPRIKLPPEIAKYIEIENCDDFNTNRYYVTQTQVDIIQAIIRDRELAEKYKKYKVNYANTTLLYGPTGTGKTTFARYVAHYFGKDFAYLNFSRLMDGGFGNTERNLSTVFRYMTAQDCIFMIDEIDCIAVSRTLSTNDTLKSITITMMQELDYCKSHNPKAIILAATNVKENLDAALLSRFSVKKEIPLLNNDDKAGFVFKYLNDLDVPYDGDQIREYIARNSRVTQRVMEQDIIRALGIWIENDDKDDIIRLTSITT